MDYDPIKDRLGQLFSRHPALHRLFFALLDVLFLRAWYVRREVHRVLSSLPADQPIDVLDAGTGFGQYAYFIARQFPHARVLAVDVKQPYLDDARRFLDATPQAHQVTFAKDDLTQLRAEGPFDFVLSVDVMEHIEDDGAVFRHFTRVLRRGGHVLINTPSHLSSGDEHGEGSFVGEHVRNGYSREALEGKLREAGLEPVRSIYTYGPYGGLAWRLLVRTPMQLLNTAWASIALLPLYYLFALPAGIVLNALDMQHHNEQGTGLLVVARKP